MPDIEKFTLFIYVSIAVLCSGIQLSYLERVWCFQVLFLSFCGGPRAAFCPITEANTFWRLHPVSLNLRTHCGSGLRRSPGPWVGAGDSPLHSPQVTLPLAPGSFLAGLCGSTDEGMKGPLEALTPSLHSSAPSSLGPEDSRSVCPAQGCCLLLRLWSLILTHCLIIDRIQSQGFKYLVKLMLPGFLLAWASVYSSLLDISYLNTY